MAYADITTKDPNPVKRWIQRRRFRDAVDILRRVAPRADAEVLDFGGGNGELLCQLRREFPAMRTALYEPTPSLRGEAREKLAAWPEISIASEIAALGTRRFDVVFCLEVFEHLSAASIESGLFSIAGLLRRDGLAVIGVPHEIFLPAVVKGLFRMTRRLGAFDAQWANIARAAIGTPPSERPATEIAPGFAYFPHHLGFDYRDLEKRLNGRFALISRQFSPAPLLGSAFNSEVYYLLRPRG